MTPAARVQAAIEVLETWLAGDEGLDRVLTAWGRTHRFAGSGDRRAIADLAYDALRRRRSAAWAAGGSEGAARDIVRGALMLSGADPAALFDGSRFAPPRLGADEMAPARDPDAAPGAVRYDYPDWLAPHLGALPEAELAALRERAPVDLRANLLRTDRDGARAALAAEGIETQPLALSPTALRVTAGARRVAGSAAYSDGLVEVQDAASQAVAALAVPPDGGQVLDYCAGGGGKALALAALAGPGATVTAHDIEPRRTADLPVRAARAGARIVLLATAALDRAGPFDVVLADAPCSGSGAWRRNPDAKWRLTPAGLERFVEIQAEVLAAASALVRPGGALVYATCSRIAAENGAQVEAFLAGHPGWVEEVRRDLPLTAGGDGFFAARLRRPGDTPGIPLAPHSR